MKQRASIAARSSRLSDKLLSGHHPRAVRRRRTLGCVGLPVIVSSPKCSFSQMMGSMRRGS